MQAKTRRSARAFQRGKSFVKRAQSGPFVILLREDSEWTGMSDILLTHCNHIFFDGKQARKMQPYPPLQTLIAAACLRADGFEVALFDATLEAPEQGFRHALERHKPRLIVICEDNFNFLTKMCLTRNRELAWFMCGAAQQAGVPVAVNSSDASDHVFDYLGHGADFVLLGEVEMTLR